MRAKILKWALKLIPIVIGQIIGSFTVYFTTKEVATVSAEALGKSVSEGMFASPYFVVLSTCIIFIFLLAYLPKRTLLDQRFSWLILGAFALVLFSSKSVIDHVKSQIYTPQFVSAKSYVKKERTLQQIYKDNGVDSDMKKHRFAMSLLKAGTHEETQLFYDVVKDGMGWMKSIFNKEDLLLHCIIYGNVETFDFLYNNGLIDLDSKLHYDRFNIAAIMSGKTSFSPLEIAIMEGKKVYRKKNFEPIA